MVLAISEYIEPTILAIGIAADVLIAIVLVWFDRRMKAIDDLKEGYEASTAKVIDARFAALNQEVMAAIKSLAKDIHRITQRLEQGDETFEHIDKKNHFIEMKIIEKMAELKDFMRETFADRTEQHALAERVRKVEIVVSRCDLPHHHTPKVSDN